MNRRRVILPVNYAEFGRHKPNKETNLAILKKTMVIKQEEIQRSGKSISILWKDLNMQDVEAMEDALSSEESDDDGNDDDGNDDHDNDADIGGILQHHLLNVAPRAVSPVIIGHIDADAGLLSSAPVSLVSSRSSELGSGISTPTAKAPQVNAPAQQSSKVVVNLKRERLKSRALPPLHLPPPPLYQNQNSAVLPRSRQQKSDKDINLLRMSSPPSAAQAQEQVS